MPLLAIGVNHKTASLAIREKLIFTPEHMPAPLFELKLATQAKEAAILSTCNRTELYCTHADPNRVMQWLHDYQKLPQNSLQDNLYVYQNDTAVKHLLRVASGLDSMVPGEPQILGQLKTAYSSADAAGTLGKRLRHLFQFVFSVAKEVRTETSVGAYPVSIASAAVDMAKHIFADISKAKVLLLGAGDTIERVIQHLQTANVTQFYIANRTLDRARSTAEKVNGVAVELNNIEEWLPQIDIVVAATASPTLLLQKHTIELALKKRKRRVMFMIDLAVPRNIDPRIAELEDVYLYTLDDLQAVINQHLNYRYEAADQAEKMIDGHAARYMQSLNVIDAVPIIHAYRNQAEAIRDAELIRAMELMRSGKISAEQAMQQLATRLTNKLLHTPTQYLRQAATDEQSEILHLAHRLQSKAN